MSKDSARAKVKITKPRIPKFCICPFCNTKQLFRKKKEHWKTVKEINIDGPILLKIQTVYAKCLNTNCKRKSFPLPIKGISKYQKATARFEASKGRNRVAIPEIIRGNDNDFRLSHRFLLGND